MDLSAVEEEAVVARGGRYVVTLGDGERAPPPDADVAALARRMHRHVAPLAPRDVYRYVMRGDFARDALGRPWDEGGLVDECDEGGNEDDWRFRIAKMSHVATPLVQCYVGEESPTLGHPWTTYSFETRELGRAAVAVDRYHRVATVRDVLRCLSRSFDAPLMRRGVTPRDRLESVRVCDVAMRDELATLGVSQWDEAVRRVECFEFSEGMLASRWTCLVDDRRAASKVIVVHHHWHVRQTWAVQERAILVHRVLPACELRFWKHAPSCDGFVELHFPALREAQEWPWWVAREALHVDARLFTGAPVDDVSLQLPWPPPTHVDPPAQHPDKRCIPILSKWAKSARATGVRAPTLLHELRLDDAEDERLADTSSLVAVRVHTHADMARLGTTAVFVQQFGAEYTTQLELRVAEDDEVGVYAVVDTSSATANVAVAAFAVVLYACVFDDGSRGVACMVDSLAVAKSHQGRGVGGIAYHELLRGQLLARYAARQSSIVAPTSDASRHVVFAQCVRTGTARTYWFDKLDESGDARSLLLQACNLDVHRVPIQAESTCGPRAREYRHVAATSDGGT